MRACSGVRSCAVLSKILGVGYIGTCWWIAAQSVVGCNPMDCPSFTIHSFISWSQPWRTKPCRINSGCQSERVGGHGPRGHLVGLSGSPRRIALVMAASGPVWGLWQRQALPEVFQLCLEFLPFYCQLLSLGHQLLEKTGNIKLKALSAWRTDGYTHMNIIITLMLR